MQMRASDKVLPVSNLISQTHVFKIKRLVEIKPVPSAGLCAIAIESELNVRAHEYGKP